MRHVLLLLSLLLVHTAAAQATADPWAADMAAFEAQDRASPPTRGGVVFTGSSSIRLWDTLAEDFRGIDVVNRGFGGSSIPDATRHAGRLVAPHKPRLVVFYAGDNDLNDGRTPRQVEKDFVRFVQRLRRDNSDIRIAYIAIKPSPARAHLLDAARDTNRRIARAAATLKGVDFIDVYTPMLGPDGQPRAELFVDDMLHMNREGYALWAKLVAPYLK